MAVGTTASRPRSCSSGACPLLDADPSLVRLAEAGYSVFPVWPVHDDGICTCPKGAACDEGPGKHPVGPRGRVASRTPRATRPPQPSGGTTPSGMSPSPPPVRRRRARHRPEGRRRSRFRRPLPRPGRLPGRAQGTAPAPWEKHPNSLEGVHGAHVYFRGSLARAAPCASPARAQPPLAARRRGPHRTARPWRRRSSPRPEGSPARSADCSAWRDGSPPRRSSGAPSSQKVARTGGGSAAHAEKAAHPQFGSGTSRSGGFLHA
jgi:hypothetical protein